MSAIHDNIVLLAQDAAQLYGENKAIAHVALATLVGSFIVYKAVRHATADDQILSPALKTAQKRNPFLSDCRRSPPDLVNDGFPEDKKNILKNYFNSNKLGAQGVHFDAIVIGSGIGSMTTAVLLAKVGLRVCVLEQHSKLGGCCHTFQEAGFEFDTGVHYVGGMNGNSSSGKILDQLTEGQLAWQPLDEELDELIIGEDLGDKEHVKKFPIYYGKKWISELIRIFPNEEKAIREYVRLTTKGYSKGSVHLSLLKMLPSCILKLLHKLSLLSWVMSYYHSITNQSTEAVVSKLTTNKDLLALFSYNWGDFGTPPQKSPFLMNSILFYHFNKYGGFYPIGGPSMIGYWLAKSVLNNSPDSKLFTKARVEEILLESVPNGGIKVKGVRIAAGPKTGSAFDLYAPVVVSGAGIYNTFNKMLPVPAKLAPTGFDLSNTLPASASYVSLFVGLRDDDSTHPLNLPLKHLWIYPTNDFTLTDRYLQENDPIGAIEKHGVPLMFVSFPSAKDPTWPKRFPGKAACLIITLANHQWFADWDQTKAKKRGEDYNQIKNHFGQFVWNEFVKLYPQLEDRVEHFEVSSPLSQNHYLGTAHGEVYGLDHCIERFAANGKSYGGLPAISALRPRTEIPGLYLTGQDISTCGVTGAMVGGLLTSATILKRNLLRDWSALSKKIASNNRNFSK